MTGKYSGLMYYAKNFPSKRGDPALTVGMALGSLIINEKPHEQAAKVAANARRWWHNSSMEMNRMMPVAYFDRLGLPRLS